ncbi:MAG: hypothetical protein V4655_08440 [Bdellovibrionota bacterium]
MPNKTIISLSLLITIAACNQHNSNKTPVAPAVTTPPVATKLTDPRTLDTNLKGLPVVKIQSLGNKGILILAEKLRLDDYNGLPVLTSEHGRQILWKHPDLTEPTAISIKPDFTQDTIYITDIAVLGESAFASFTYLTSTPKTLEHGLAHITLNDTGEPKIEYHAIPKAEFPDLDQQVDIFAMSYKYFDTMNVSRIATHGNQLALVARNNVGTLFTDRFTISGDQWIPGARQSLLKPIVAMRVGLTGGTYDVMNELTSVYHVHVTFQNDGTLVVASLTESDDITLTKEFGTEALTDYYERRSGLYAAVTKVPSLPDQPINTNWQYWGNPIGDSQLQSLTATDNEIFLTGLSRSFSASDKGRSIVRVSTGVKGYIDPKKQSASAQAFLCLKDKPCLIGGSWNWAQNPEGMSISGGEAYVATYERGATDLKVDPKFLATVTSENGRSEVRSFTSHKDDIICAAGMTNGPSTHTADSDSTLMKGDGFIRCLFAEEIFTAPKP